MLQEESRDRASGGCVVSSILTIALIGAMLFIGASRFGGMVTTPSRALEAEAVEEVSQAVSPVAPAPTSVLATTAPATPVPTATSVPPTTVPPTVAAETSEAGADTTAADVTPETALGGESGADSTSVVLAAGAYDPALVSQGEALFAACSACHGPDGRGVPNLGKDLVASEFVASLSDNDLVTFIKTGRPIWDPANTTGIDMPPKGGNPALTDEDIHAIVAYMRSIHE